MTQPHQPGPVYDDAMKILADDGLAALLTLVGVEGEDSRPLPAELPGSSMRADLLAETPGGVVHVEYVKDPSPDLDLRMIDYYVRLLRRDRTVPIRQHLLVLRGITVPEFYDDGVLRHTWNTVRIPQLDPAVLMAHTTTAPLAPLARGTPDQRAATLGEVASLILAETDPDRRRRLARAAETLASIVLPRRIIDATLQEAAMPVPTSDTPMGQWLREERDMGRQEGRQEAARHLVAAWLRRRFGTDPRIDAVAERLSALPDDDLAARVDGAQSLEELLS